MVKDLPIAFLLIITIIGVSTYAQAPLTDRDRAIDALQVGNYSLAVDLAKKAVKKEPGNAAAWRVLASSYIGLDKYKDAVKAIQKAVAIEPSNPQYLTLLAYGYLMLRDNKALAAADTALKLNPDNADAEYVMAVLSYRSGLYLDAYERMKRAIKIKPELPQLYWLRSQALISTFAAMHGKIISPATRADLLTEGLADLEKYASLMPASSGDRELQERIRSVRYFTEYYNRPEVRDRPATAVPTPAEPNTTPLKILSKSQAGYTNSARERGVSGIVRVIVAFEADGTIGPIMVVTSLDDGLDAAVIAAARKIKFVPPTRNGIPYSTVKTIEYSFDIY